VVVTSRCQLNGLVAAQGAHPVSLGLLTEDEARQLLAGRLGRARLAAEPRSADKLISVCARLPLALSIAAAQAATRPGRPLAALAAELHDARNQLDVFDAGDDASVRAAFSWSYGELTERAARMFRLLGLHPGPDISPLAGASLSGLPLDEACHILAELVRAHLIEEHVPGRFTFHDLLYAYARERAREGETETGRQTAITRMLDHYLHTAHGAALLLHPARDPIALGPLTSGTMPERLSSQAKALTWFDAEHRVLLAAVTLASDAGCPGHAWQIAWALANFLDRRGHWDDARSVQQIALAASRKAGDKAGQAHANSLMGRAEVRLGHHDEGRERFREALALFRAVGDRAACARAYLDLGWVANQQGRHSDATAPTLQALAMYRSIGHEVGEAHTLSNLGWHYAILGNHQRAIACCREALTLHRAHGNVVVHAATLDTLGYIHHLLDDYPQAIHYYQQAITRLEKLGARIRVADSLSHLADAHVASGNPRAARQAWQEALTILEQLGHPDAADVRSKLGYFREQLVPHAAQ
jgi:tetratricopeptide (TPR) repeat protein